MALNFPYNPSVGQIYTDTTSGFSYEWSGAVWKSYTNASASTIQTLDDISSSFDGAETVFALKVGSGDVSVAAPDQLIISTNDQLRAPGTDYTLSYDNAGVTSIVFGTPPTGGWSFSGVLLGRAIPITYPTTDGTGDVYNAKTYTATAGQTTFTPDNSYTVGYIDVYRNGVKLTASTDFTATNGTTVVLSTPAQLNDEIVTIGWKVNNINDINPILTNLKVSGISTQLGQVNYGASGIGATIYANGNASFTGIVTATQFETAAGTGVTIFSNGNIAAAGVITATSFVGDVTGDVTGNADTATTATNAQGLTGAPSIIVTNLTVNGTETIINTNELNVRDKTVGIGSTTTPTSTTQDGAGIIIYGQTQVDFLYDNDKAAIGLNTALSVAGFVTATSFSGDGSALTGVISGIDVQADGSLTGTASTALNFSGVTITSDNTVGISTITVAAAGLGTEAITVVPATGITTYLDLTNAQDHLITASGVTTISATGGSEGESHTLRIVNSGITTIGFNTYFVWPNGAAPSLVTTDEAINLISFTVHKAGAAGTTLLAGASQNFS